MANPTGAFGLRPSRHLDGSPWNAAIDKCYVSAAYDTAIFRGDPVLLTPTAAEKDPTARYQTVNASAGTDATIIYGVVTGIDVNPDNLSRTYLPAATGGLISVCIDWSFWFPSGRWYG